MRGDGSVVPVVTISSLDVGSGQGDRVSTASSADDASASILGGDFS
ncbi:hypothetical protein Rrhod_3220 [Rhodococcus rhodnii LMG 5362]|uniref:Uncharacterized protein n=1 Tax=Rhodococcus rhodnii LMG 5362 TaxID=1273125 RepID=R7WJG0_9NOCA|nr:hypothetical protein Rrhod_3220 [Rhodococcus rhodnii LMG 5362]